MTEAHQESLADQVDKQARDILWGLLRQNKSTVQIGKEYGFNRGLIPYVLDGGHSPTVLEALGLPVYERREVEVCPTCGEVHTMHKMCMTVKRNQVRYRKSADMESPEQQDALDRIAEDNGFASFTEMCRAMAKDWLDGATIILDSDSGAFDE